MIADDPASHSGQDRPKVKPINPPTRWYRRSKPWITVVVVVGLLAAGVSWWSPWRTVRVTDGGDVFANNLVQVQGLIQDENNRVAKSGRPWVGIALMLPIRPPEGESDTPPWVKHHIQGAYLAQYWSNHSDGDANKFRDEIPLSRLMLTDIGPDGDEWQDTVAQLVEMAEPGDGAHLVAVTGLGPSTTALQEAANELSRHRIPMVGSIISATTLAADGLVRVSPSNSDEAAAAIAFLKTTDAWKYASHTTPYTAYLVQDRDKTNTYAEDLGRQYRNISPTTVYTACYRCRETSTAHNPGSATRWCM